MEEKKGTKVSLLSVILILIMLVMVAGLVYVYLDNQKLNKKLAENDNLVEMLNQKEDKIKELEKQINISNNSNSTNNTYIEITDNLLANCEGLYVTNVVKNTNNTYTLQGVLFDEYLLSNNELIEIVNKGKMEVNGEEYLVKQNDSLGSEKAYILYNSNNNWKYDIIQIDYNHWKLEIAAQIPAYYKTLGIKAQITVDKNVICNEHYQDEEGTSKTVEDTFSNFKSCTAPKDVGTGKIWNIEMKNGKCIKLTRFLGV